MLAHAFLAAAVTIVGSHVRQGGGGLFGELAQFGHFSQNGGGHDGTAAGNGVEAFGFVRQHRIGGDESGDGLVALRDLFLQGFKALACLPQTQRMSVPT